MFKIGDIVMVQGCKDLEPIKAKIIDMGPDESGKIWYECVPVEFKSISREFTEDKLEKVY